MFTKRTHARDPRYYRSLRQRFAASKRRRASKGIPCLRLGKEEYGINILKVQEIRGYDAVTRIANAPEFINGVVNLRAIIVPIVDMRALLL
jgi:chemotaxis signal transduction protein